MDDLDKYIDRRKKRSRKFASTFELGYHEFKIGAILKRAREDSGLTQDEVALRLKTKKRLFSFNYGNFCPKSDRPGHQLKT